MSHKTLLRGGVVLTLGARTSNHLEADVLLEDGKVAEVGRGLRARDAEQFDASDCIVMPGFVDAHRHLWKSLFRNLGDAAVDDSTLAGHYRPDDVYAATLIGLLGSAEAGTTTVVDWYDAPLEDAHIDAALQAHFDSGLRTVFALSGGRQAAGDLSPRLSRLVERAGAGKTTIAYGAPDTSSDGWTAARTSGLRIHAHIGTTPDEADAGSRLAEGGSLGADVTLVHCTYLDDSSLAAISSSGARVVICPSAEMAGGLGYPPIQRFVDQEIRLGLGVDDERLAPGDIFAQMRAVISIQHAAHFDLKLAGKSGLPSLMTTREVLRFATLDGARAVGLESAIGSIEVGKQADVIVLRADRPNIWPINDAIGAVVWGMDTSNIDSVFVAGEPLVRGGTSVADTSQARRLATAAQQHVGEAAGLFVGGKT
jgi:5-methylthioadenosine/S-adenosylhomocysteine deaminase